MEAFLRIGEWTSPIISLNEANGGNHASSPADSLPLDVQASEESFDLALVASLEIDVVPHLGDARVPDYVVTSLAKVLQLGSRITLRDEDDIGGYRPLSPESPPATPARANAKRTSTDSDIDSGLGSTDPGRFVPRERFSYWCFDLLFLICSDTAKGVFGLLLSMKQAC